MILLNTIDAFERDIESVATKVFDDDKITFMVFYELFLETEEFSYSVL
jgi:hypothetical protein